MKPCFLQSRPALQFCKPIYMKAKQPGKGIDRIIWMQKQLWGVGGPGPNSLRRVFPTKGWLKKKTNPKVTPSPNFILNGGGAPAVEKNLGLQHWAALVAFMLGCWAGSGAILWVPNPLRTHTSLPVDHFCVCNVFCCNLYFCLQFYMSMSILFTPLTAS